MTEQELQRYMLNIDEEREMPPVDPEDVLAFRSACGEFGYVAINGALINFRAMRTLRISRSVRGLVRAVFDLNDLRVPDVFVGPYIEIDEVSGHAMQRPGIRLFQKRLKLVQDESRRRPIFKSEQLA